MFICNKCLKKKFKNGESLFKSGGRCEICGESAVCNDIHHSKLIDKDIRTDIHGRVVKS